VSNRPDLPCSYCDRLCHSDIGKVSHECACQARLAEENSTNHQTNLCRPSVKTKREKSYNLFSCILFLNYFNFFSAKHFFIFYFLDTVNIIKLEIGVYEEGMLV
jgi:hypothetical protein